MIGLLCGIIVGFLVATICYKLDLPTPPVGGKLILDTSNVGEVVYQLIIYDQTGEKMKNMKRILVDVENNIVELPEDNKNETDSD